MSLSSRVESILFVASRALSLKKIAEAVGASEKETEHALAEYGDVLGTREAGVILVRDGKDYQLMTAPEHAPNVQNFLKEEMTGELTRPSLETLTIIAYRGPVTKAEVEQIRGVNCSLILRNLLIRGLVETRDDPATMATRYAVTMDFLRFLGVARVDDLPNFQELNADKTLADLLSGTPGASADAAPPAV